MKKTLLLSIVIFACTSLVFAEGSASKITGSYVEIRSNDVYVGACYANSQIGLIGREGTMAWNVKSGEFMGVPLQGLSAVAVILGSNTLGDKFLSYGPIRSVLILDARASELQRDALRAFVRTAAGKMLGNVVREEVVPIRFEQVASAVDHQHMIHEIAASTVNPAVKVTAGSLVTLETRELRHTDNLCANAEIFYNPLTGGLKGATPVFGKQMSFRGQGLGSQWSIPDNRGGYVADFEFSMMETSQQ